MQAFVNSFWDLDREGGEMLVSPEALAEWLVARELLEPGTKLSPADLIRALDVREGLRALMFANNDIDRGADAIPRLNAAVRAPGLYVQLDRSASPDFKRERRDLDTALALIATIVAVAQLDGTWSRMKACPGNHCGWCFYDNSRNQSSGWCSMSVCGGRAKAREYRRRRGRGATG